MKLRQALAARKAGKAGANVNEIETQPFEATLAADACQHGLLVVGNEMVEYDGQGDVRRSLAREFSDEALQDSQGLDAK